MTDSREIKAKVTTSGHGCAAAYKELLEQVSVVSNYFTELRLNANIYFACV